MLSLKSYPCITCHESDNVHYHCLFVLHSYLNKLKKLNFENSKFNNKNY